MRGETLIKRGQCWTLMMAGPMTLLYFRAMCGGTGVCVRGADQGEATWILIRRQCVASWRYASRNLDQGEAVCAGTRAAGGAEAAHTR